MYSFRCFNRHLLMFCFLILFFLINDMVDARELRKPAPEFRRHRIIQPRVHHARTKRELSTTRHMDGRHHPEVMMQVNIDGEQHELELQLNEDLVAGDHVLSYQQGGKNVLHRPSKEELDICQYSGSIRDKPGSWAAVSTCHGVRGVIYDTRSMKYIEPAEDNEITSSHYIYDHADLATSYHCGVPKKTGYDPHLIKKHADNEHLKRIRRHKRQSLEESEVRGPYNSNSLSRYVELVLVADHGEFLASGDIRTVHRQMKDVANIINSIYAPLNIFIALVGVVVWTEKDEINLDEDGDRTLSNFLRYRRTNLLADIKNDNMQLVTLKRFQGGVVGKALKGPICTYQYSGGISTNYSAVIGLLATTIAHMLGHNFGMEHDTADCKCPDEKCIMSSSTGLPKPVHWSSCSVKSLELAFEMEMDYCLRNKPARLFDGPTCGNGFVEPGEECDCGLIADSTVRDACRGCCHADTCLLRGNATCAAGACCNLQTCRPKSAGTMCRSADKECDLPEYCTGYSEFCPKDVYKMDSTPCGKLDEAFCVAGSCGSHSDQCKRLWGTTGENSHHKCYTLNTRGGKFGNCGYDALREVYSACAELDVSCGRLQCRHNNDRLEFGMESASILSQSILNYNGTLLQCRTAVIDLGLSDVDPGLVPDGAKCGDNKMCYKQRCVDINTFRADVAICPSYCSGHGVCDSEAQNIATSTTPTIASTEY